MLNNREILNADVAQLIDFCSWHGVVMLLREELSSDDPRRNNLTNAIALAVPNNALTKYSFEDLLRSLLNNSVEDNIAEEVKVELEKALLKPMT